MRIVIIGISLCFLFAYLVDIAVLVNAQRENEYAAENWVEGEALVAGITSYATGSRLGGSGLIIIYEYSFSGETYRGSRQNFYDNKFVLEEQKQARDYEYGEILKIWLNPNNPQQSVVDIEGEADGRYPKRIFRSSILAILSTALAVIVYLYGSKLGVILKRSIAKLDSPPEEYR